VTSICEAAARHLRLVRTSEPGRLACGQGVHHSPAGQKKGVTIPAADGLIAATALRHGLHVATRNRPHFEQAGAMVINPWLTSSAAVQ
jgi:hypothetical protein